MVNFDFILTKKRNRLACATVQGTAKVHCNLRLLDRIEKKSATMTPTFSGLQMKILTDEV